jgi:hypothetical protein
MRSAYQVTLDTKKGPKTVDLLARQEQQVASSSTP